MTDHRKKQVTQNTQGYISPEKTAEQAQFLVNRLLKNKKRLHAWALQHKIKAMRIFDNDIPELPLVLEEFCDVDGERAVTIALYERPYEREPSAENAWLTAMARASGQALGIAERDIFIKFRRRMRGLAQYEAQHSVNEVTQYFKEFGRGKKIRRICEDGLIFEINLADYLDTGLFLDQRILRARIHRSAREKRVLNLFCYTGSFSLMAAHGGASLVDSVDLSNTYLEWAQRNFNLNKNILGASADGQFNFIKSEAREFLARAQAQGRRYDIIILDPPSFSNSKASPRDFDIIEEWPHLLKSCLALLAPAGSLYFSTNARKLKFDEELARAQAADRPITIRDLTATSIASDFRDQKIHRLWQLETS